MTQEATLAREFTGMLTGPSYANARPLLNGSDYYMINASATSLNGLSSTVVELPHVPAVKYGIECEATQPGSPVGATTLGLQQVIVSFPTNNTNSDSQSLMSAYYPGKIEVLQDADNSAYPFAAFAPWGDQNLYLGFGTSFNISSDTMSTKFGTLHATAQNMTTLKFTGTKEIMSWWGMRCWLKQTPGTIDLRRSANSSWYQASADWADNDTTVTPHWFLQHLQVIFDYSAPSSTVPGIAPAMAAKAADQTAVNMNYFDYEASALNLLYAECETRRMVYETALSNKSQPTYSYETTAGQTTQYYRITYVPLILFVAVAAIFACSAICLILTIWTRHTASGQQMRSVDVLRFVIDSVAGLRHDESFTQMRHRSNGEIDRWSDSYLVQYRIAVNDGGLDSSPHVVLTKAVKGD